MTAFPFSVVIYFTVILPLSSKSRLLFVPKHWRLKGHLGTLESNYGRANGILARRQFDAGDLEFLREWQASTKPIKSNLLYLVLWQMVTSIEY